MASMQLDADLDLQQAKAPFYSFVERVFPGVSRESSHDKSSIEIYAEKQEEQKSEPNLDT